MHSRVSKLTIVDSSNCLIKVSSRCGCFVYLTLFKSFRNFQPALSVGNVGQLAVDLLVSSLKADKIGYLDDPNVLPCVGNDAYSPAPPGKLALPVEGFIFLIFSNFFVLLNASILIIYSFVCFSSRLILRT